MKTINDYNFENKKALIRVDFNVPQDENLNVTDDTRIRAAKPTIDKILQQGGAVILMSHLGRPKGEFNDKYSLKHIASSVSEILAVLCQPFGDAVVLDTAWSANVLAPRLGASKGN